MPRRSVASARQACLLVACTVFVFCWWDAYTASDPHTAAWGGLTRVAMAAEEGEAAAAVFAEEIPNEAANFHDEAAAEVAEAAATAAAAAETVDAATAAPAAGGGLLDLDGFSEEELKALLSDKKKGNVNFKHYQNRAELIAAIREMEKKEMAQQAFREEVAAAGRWYVESREEMRYQRAAARRAKSSRIKHDGEVPAALRHQNHDGAAERQHELRIVYNEANGYAVHYATVAKDLERTEGVRLPNFDAVRIVGETYPIDPLYAMLSQAMQVCFYGVLALAVVPDMVPFVPEPARNFMRNRRSLVISTAFMLNMASRSLTQNYAFEVYLDGELIYSALKFGGRLPTSEMISNLVLERTLLKDYAAAMSAKAAAALL